MLCLNNTSEFEPGTFVRCSIFISAYTYRYACNAYADVRALECVIRLISTRKKGSNVSVTVRVRISLCRLWLFLCYSGGTRLRDRTKRILAQEMIKKHGDL